MYVYSHEKDSLTSELASSSACTETLELGGVRKPTEERDTCTAPDTLAVPCQYGSTETVSVIDRTAVTRARSARVRMNSVSIQ